MGSLGQVGLQVGGGGAPRPDPAGAEPLGHHLAGGAPTVQTSPIWGRSIGLRWAWTSSQSALTKAAAFDPTVPGSTLATPVTWTSRSPGIGPRTRTTRPTLGRHRPQEAGG